MPPRATLAVALTCRDNRSTIDRLLDSVRPVASDIVAVDNGSTDGTIERLELARARVVRSPWLGYVRTKNLAAEHARADWLLHLDSDESIDQPLQDALRALLDRDPGEGPGAYRLRRKTWVHGRFLEHAWQPEWRLRLARRGHAAWIGPEPHESLDPTPGTTVGTLSGVIRHDSFPTFRDHLARQLVYARAAAERLHAEGARGSIPRLATAPPGAFLKQIVLKRAFLDGWPGWLAAASTAAGSLMKHMILLELDRTSPRTTPPEQDRRR